MNELLLTSLHRADLFSLISCRAWNSNLTASLTSSVILDMNLDPVDVAIVSFKRPLTAGEKTEVICQSRGSRPPATLSWFLNDQPIRDFVSQSTSEDGNLTTSILNFVPSPHADGHVLRCQAVMSSDFVVVSNSDQDPESGVAKSDENRSSSSDSQIDMSSREMLLSSTTSSKRTKMKPKISSSQQNSGRRGEDEDLLTLESTFSNSISKSGARITSSGNMSTSASSSILHPETSKSKLHARGKKKHSPSRLSPHRISDDWKLQIFCESCCCCCFNLLFQKTNVICNRFSDHHLHSLMKQMLQSAKRVRTCRSR